VLPLRRHLPQKFHRLHLRRQKHHLRPGKREFWMKFVSEPRSDDVDAVFRQDGLSGWPHSPKRGGPCFRISCLHG
jgi:hypothetical protein